MTARVKMALLGCGNIAQSHWQGIQDHASLIEVTTLVDTDLSRAEAMAEQTDGQAFDSLEKALAAGDFAAVDIMLPHHLHEEAALRSFAAGKHVVLEKPMAPTLDACERILAAAKEAGTVFMVAEQSHYWPDALKAQQLIQDGTIGQPISARATFTSAAEAYSGPKPWRYYLEKMGGGVCIDGGAHWIRPLRMWLGEIDEVVAVVGHPETEMEGESLTRALLRFDSGVVAVFEALYGGEFERPGEEFRITGTKGELVIQKGDGDHLTLFDQAHPEGALIRTTGSGREAGFGYELADFTHAIIKGKPLAATPEYSLGELRTALAIYRSATTRQWEKVWA